METLHEEKLRGEERLSCHTEEEEEEEDEEHLHCVSIERLVVTLMQIQKD